MGGHIFANLCSGVCIGCFDRTIGECMRGCFEEERLILGRKERKKACAFRNKQTRLYRKDTIKIQRVENGESDIRKVFKKYGWDIM